ncbi:Histidine phosphatase superfamily clade-2 [Penicillium verhagenii]|nr:Histidine phosphatase superfamily clade-2 [Penicillium verhagenii]
MLKYRGFLVLVTLIFQICTLAGAEYTEKVWSVFAYTLYGDSTPDALLEQHPAGLSDYGAYQLAAAGAAFRNRYVSSAGSTNATEFAIQEISASILMSKNLEVLSTTEENVIASAQAFMIGLYPPLGNEDMNTTDETANGTTYSAPLDGYQFPRIVTLGESDPGSLFVAGQSGCTMHQAAVSEYQSSGGAAEITQDTEVFYQKLLHQVLSGVYDESTATYANAVGIADYLEYEVLHNSTALDHLFGDDLIRARSLADQFTYATNGQDASVLSESTIGAISPIAGQTLATSILKAFNMSMEEQGNGHKMTLLFGSDEPAVALASLMGLDTEQHPGFYSRPVRGASMVFELYSFETDGDDDSYPSSSDMYVRFFLHNGTDSSTEFVSFPLFGYGPSQTYIPWTEFESEMETFSVQSVDEWCLLCNASSVFCAGALSRDDSTPKKKAMTPAVAGVIGAVVTLVVMGLVAVAVFFVCGLRKREGRQDRSKKSSIGGFKGTSKLASDADVSFHNPLWGTGKEAGKEQDDGAVTGGVIVRGQERLGSWEMGEPKSETEGITPTKRGASFEDSSVPEDPEEWRLHSRLHPVKIRESV